MSCAACAVSVESMLGNTSGVSKVTVNYANQSATVDYDPTVITPVGMQQVLQGIGYDLVVDVEDPTQVQQEAQQQHYEALKKRTIWAALLSAPVGMFFMDSVPYANYIMKGSVGTGSLPAWPVVFRKCGQTGPPRNS